MWIILAAGGPPRGGSTPNPNATQLFFSGNWAAVIGVIMCALLLVTWIHYRMKELDDAEEDKNPREY